MDRLENIKVVENGKIIDEFPLSFNVAAEIVDSWNGPLNQMGGRACNANIDLLTNTIFVSCQQGYGYAELLAALRRVVNRVG